MKDIDKKYEKFINDGGIFTLASTEAVNFKPHPFVIGTRHITYASDYNGGIIDDSVMSKVPCAACGEPLSSHTYDTVMFLRFSKNITGKEAKVELQRIVKEIEDKGDKEKIDGFAFIKNEFKVLPSEEEGSDEHN